MIKAIACVKRGDIAMTTSTATISTTCLTALVTGLMQWLKTRYDIIWFQVPILVTYFPSSTVNSAKIGLIWLTTFYSTVREVWSSSPIYGTIFVMWSFHNWLTRFVGFILDTSTLPFLAFIFQGPIRSNPTYRFRRWNFDPARPKLIP